MHLKTVTDAVARVDGLTYPVGAVATVKVSKWCPKAVLLAPQTKMTPATG